VVRSGIFVGRKDSPGRPNPPRMLWAEGFQQSICTVVRNALTCPEAQADGFTEVQLPLVLGPVLRDRLPSRRLVSGESTTRSFDQPAGQGLKAYFGGVGAVGCSLPEAGSGIEAAELCVGAAQPVGTPGSIAVPSS
jgi:hypothetical protein